MKRKDNILQLPCIIELETSIISIAEVHFSQLYKHLNEFIPLPDMPILGS